MKKKSNILIVVIMVVALAIILWPRAEKGRSEMTICDMFANATTCTDAEPVAARFPWLQIESCQWKSLLLGGGGVPGPSEVMVCGYIETAEEYIKWLQNTYKWSDSNVAIRMLPEGTEEDQINLQMSPEYNKFYTPLQNNASVQLYVDFDLKLVYFSGTFQ